MSTLIMILIVILVAVTLVLMIAKGRQGRMLRRVIIIIGTLLITTVPLIEGVINERNHTQGNNNSDSKAPIVTGASTSGFFSENDSLEFTDDKQTYFTVYTDSDMVESFKAGNAFSTVKVESDISTASKMPLKNCADGNPSKRWQESEKGYPTGKVIVFNLDKDEVPNGILIWNGDGRSEEKYKQNGRLKTITLLWGTGSEITITLEDYYGYQYVEFDTADTESTSYISMRIDSVYKGTNYKDLCISDIKFFYGDK